MAVVGCLGDIVFQVSRETVRTIDNVVWSGSARYGVHHKHLGNALTEFTGLDPDKISFTMLLSKGLGASVIGDVAKLFDMERKGRAVSLVIGSKSYGKYRWNVLRHSARYTGYDRNGDPYTAQVTVELQEYLKVG